LCLLIFNLQAEANRYPYSVSMQDGGGHFCGGSMIAKVSMRYMCFLENSILHPTALEVYIIDNT